MDNEPAEPSRKRLRASHACDVCRSRKIRCDGNNPCATCSAAEQECTYGSEANSRGKSDLILEGVLRVERFLQEMNTTLSTSAQFSHRPFLASSARGPPSASFSGSPPADASPYPGPMRQTGYPSLENAFMDSLHTSTTESVLQWPHFDVFPSLGRGCIPIFELEQSRPGIPTKPTNMHPYVAPEEINDIISVFENSVNFWYPTTSLSQLQQSRMLVVADVPGADVTETCLSLLTIALGCASQAISGLSATAMISSEERKRREIRRALGDSYFDAALSKLHIANTKVTSTSTHCLFFVAMYFAFLRRPLQAWEYINAAAAKCLLLLAYRPASETPEDQERTRRIFWSCYILESDYLAELSALPQSGIAQIESSIPLPGEYRTHHIAAEEEKSSLYFLACISMRRLLNRVHQLLFARETGTALDIARFPYVVAELDHQLEEWRDVLPAAFAFSVDAEPATTEHGGFLRQRYLTCRSVIYRPYLMWVLGGFRGGRGSYGANGASGDVSQDVLTNCKACLDACLLHVLNLRGFAQTVLVDTWICSLSMAGAMLVLLAACRVRSLRGLIGPEVLRAGDHLKQLLEGWQQVAGDPSSPSVDQSVRIICEVDRYIREVYEPT